MNKRVHQNLVEGPSGEVIKINWFSDKVRFDFVNCGKVSVTKIFPVPKGLTNIEVDIKQS